MAAYLSVVSDYVGEARVLLMDTISPYRYPDLDIVNALNITLFETFALRPDLFLGHSYADADDDDIGTFVANNTSTVFMPVQARPAILRGVVCHCLLRDQEDVMDQRAIMFQKDFYRMLGVQLPAEVEG